MTLPLTFPRDSLVTIGCANGTKLRYEIWRHAPGRWMISIERNERCYGVDRVFSSKPKAKAWARDHFRRHQILKLAA